MPQFAVLIYAADSGRIQDRVADDQLEYDQHAEDLAASEAMRLAYAFTSRSEAVSISAAGERPGPFVDAAQVVAGFYVLDAPDLASATRIASANPVVRTSTGGVEVRPVHSGGIVRADGPSD